MQLIQRANGPSKWFKNTQVYLWNYGEKVNIYWLQEQPNKTKDLQLIYQLTIYAN